jgi:glycine/D-amino acid oxidase-like deaminating enzyme
MHGLTNQESRVDAAIGAYKWPAATLNPAKLTLGIHTLNIEKGGYELYSFAPVHSVTQTEAEDEWTVTTPRGSVKTGKVVFATNAYSQAIVPELEGLVTPWRAQAILLPPAPVGEAVFPKLEPSL